MSFAAAMSGSGRQRCSATKRQVQQSCVLLNHDEPSHMNCTTAHIMVHTLSAVPLMLGLETSRNFCLAFKHTFVAIIRSLALLDDVALLMAPGMMPGLPLSCDPHRGSTQPASSVVKIAESATPYLLMYLTLYTNMLRTTYETSI